MFFVRKKLVQSGSKKRAPTVVSRARYYQEVNNHRPRSYWDYTNYEIQWSTPDDYAILKKIGRGKYSNVFLGVQITTGKKVCIKTLIPVRRRKIRREVKILQNLQGGPNIIKFISPVQNNLHGCKALIFEYIENVPFNELDSILTDEDVRYYVYELLKALEWCHSKGIIHRDVKPQNVMVDHKRKKLALIDWGLAEFYHPEQVYNVRVSSRHFKGPELLIKYEMYDYSLDMWSLGCLIAGVVFGKAPFFHGRDNNDQLIKIINVLGTETFHTYTTKYELPHPDWLTSTSSQNIPKKSLETFVKMDNLRLVSREVLDFLDNVLQYDHSLRLTATEALQHKWFERTRKAEENGTDHYRERAKYSKTDDEVSIYEPLDPEAQDKFFAAVTEQKQVAKSPDK